MVTGGEQHNAGKLDHTVVQSGDTLHIQMVRRLIEAPLRSIYVDVATNYNGGISQRVFYRESTDITCFNLDTILNDVLTEAAKTNATFLDISIPDWLVAYPASALQNET